MFSLENWPEMVKLEGSLLKVFIGPSEKKKRVSYMVKCIRQAWDPAGLRAQALGHQGWRCGLQAMSAHADCGTWLRGWSPSGEELQQKRRKRERKEDPLASFPRKNGRKHKYTRQLVIGVLKKIKHFLHFYGNIGKPQWNEQFLRKTKCIQVNPSRNRKLLSIPIEEIGQFSGL